jgi:hypothetical protein
MDPSQDWQTPHLRLAVTWRIRLGAQFFENEEFLYGRRFDLKAQARQWAASETTERERDEWKLMEPTKPQ